LCLRNQKINAMTEYSLKKYAMWNKVNELFSKGLNKSQISRELGLDRGTVRRYLRLNYKEFISSSSFKRNYTHKLSNYESYIKSRLEYYNNLSSSQIFDNLRENYPDMPKVHYKTVYNYVKLIRAKYNIPRTDKGFRELNKLPETLPGEYAQVDFGEKRMRDANNQIFKVYFFCLVLSYSRYKYVYIQTTPFTTSSTIYAHELAFDYLQGIPKKIIYDQDKVLISSENLGDYHLTEKFKAFVNQTHFEPIFCRKSDPQSKGKVENVVKYVKYNFLQGREFTNIEQLNKEVLLWLKRTANGFPHNGTRLIPQNVYNNNRDKMLPYYGTPHPIIEKPKEYLVRKDNTIMYKCNYYTVPSGTYTGSRTFVYVNINGRQLEIYDKSTGKTIALHTISLSKGVLVKDYHHARKNKGKTITLENKVKESLDNNPIVIQYLTATQRIKPRYYYDTLKILQRIINEFPKENIIKEISNQVLIYQFNANELFNILALINERSKLKNNSIEAQYNTDKFIPETRHITDYKNLL